MGEAARRPERGGFPTVKGEKCFSVEFNHYTSLRTWRVEDHEDYQMKYEFVVKPACDGLFRKKIF